jgi:hypothetical protein
VRSTVFLALEMETWDAPKYLQPDCRVTTDLDLRFDGSIRVEGLIEQIAYDACLGLVAGRADVVDGQVVVDTHVALDETGHLPVVAGAVEALEDQDVAAAGGAAIALASALVVWMREGGADGVT